MENFVFFNTKQFIKVTALTGSILMTVLPYDLFTEGVTDGRTHVPFISLSVKNAYNSFHYIHNSYTRMQSPFQRVAHCLSVMS